MGSIRQLWHAGVARGRATYHRAMRWIVRNVPPGARTLLGLLLIVGGVFGFLPILGFWMIPLGVAVILLDVTMIRRWRRGRRVDWGWRRRRQQADPVATAPREDGDP